MFKLHLLSDVLSNCIMTLNFQKSSPIGVFDSGLGGITVFNEIRKVLPNEDLIYLGDTARVPYGTKSKTVVTEYSRENVKFLISKGVKVVVVACNTASASALETLQEEFRDILIIGVIEPVISNLLILDNVSKVGVIGTTTTISSQTYQNRIKDKIEVDVYSQSCPLFVPYVEEGIIDGAMIMQVIEYYLNDLKQKQIDALILGCTHYPLLKKPLTYFFGNNVKMLDSAFYTARELKKLLINNDLLNNTNHNPKELFYVTDDVFKFKKNAEVFLNKKSIPVEQI